jgi:hypothetical protein
MTIYHKHFNVHPARIKMLKDGERAAAVGRVLTHVLSWASSIIEVWDLEKVFVFTNNSL